MEVISSNRVHAARITTDIPRPARILSSTIHRRRNSLHVRRMMAISPENTACTRMHREDRSIIPILLVPRPVMPMAPAGTTILLPLLLSR